MAEHEPTTGRSALPWDDLMEAGLGRLRLAPDVFWGMTLPELQAALRGAFGNTDISPLWRDFESLMTQFPDEGS